MQRQLPTIATFLLLVALSATPGDAVECTAEDFARAVNEAGAALRKLSAENAPRLQAKMGQLKTKMKWPDTGYEERAYQALQDERVASFDTDANALLARIDALGTLDPGGVPECGRLQELQAASLELQATVKTKTAYLVSKLDQMMSDAPVPKAKTPEAKAADTTTAVPEAKIAAAPDPAPVPSPPAAAPRQPAASGWSTNTTGSPPSGDMAMAPAPLPDPAAPADEGYTIDEIRAASAGFFGQVSANLGSVIEYLFAQSGRPTGYVLGTEGGGAFLAGVRYGNGTLYLRGGGTQPIFWHGPSVGFDVGGEGSKTLFLIYKLTAAEDLYTTFTGIDGSAYLVGGVGATLVTNGSVIMAPIRSGIGLRIGANLGYIRFTPKGTWNPF